MPIQTLADARVYRYIAEAFPECYAVISQKGRLCIVYFIRLVLDIPMIRLRVLNNEDIPFTWDSRNIHQHQG